MSAVLLVLVCLLLRQLSVHASNLGLHTLVGARCGSHICTTADEITTYMHKYQHEEHLYKYAAIATGIAACLTAGTGLLYSGKLTKRYLKGEN